MGVTRENARSICTATFLIPGRTCASDGYRMHVAGTGRPQRPGGRGKRAAGGRNVVDHEDRRALDPHGSTEVWAPAAADPVQSGLRHTARAMQQTRHWYPLRAADVACQQRSVVDAVQTSAHGTHGRPRDHVGRRGDTTGDGDERGRENPQAAARTAVFRTRDELADDTLVREGRAPP